MVVCLADRCASVRERYRDQSSPARYALIIVTEGKVRVRDRRKNRTLQLSAPGSYTARGQA